MSSITWQLDAERPSHLVRLSDPADFNAVEWYDIATDRTGTVRRESRGGKFRLRAEENPDPLDTYTFVPYPPGGRDDQFVRSHWAADIDRARRAYAE